MGRNMRNIIVVKIGTSVLTSPNGQIRRDVIASLSDDVGKLQKSGYLLVIVSSGAIGCGRSVSQFSDPNFVVSPSDRSYDKRLLREQVLAAVGQSKLIAAYSEEFGRHGLECAQILVTRSDFSDRQRYLSLRTVCEELLRNNVIPIFNENDVLSPEELDFSDNDQLALMVSVMISPEQLVILTDVAGVYDGPVGDPNTKLLPEIRDVDAVLQQFKTASASPQGKGGVYSKLLTADVLTNLGIPMRVASGTEPSVLSRIVSGEQLGTFFPSSFEKRPEGVRGWMAAAATAEGAIVVSTYLAERIRTARERPDRKTVSILLPGIETVRGDFAAGEIVDVIDDGGNTLGRGAPRFSADELRKKISWYRALSESEREQVRTSASIMIHANSFVYAK
ncbi:MAG: glutamate 5-kinase [bacterium]|nr:glutamate 5-kinase [bacterium]